MSERDDQNEQQQDERDEKHEPHGAPREKEVQIPNFKFRGRLDDEERKRHNIEVEQNEGNEIGYGLPFVEGQKGTVRGTPSDVSGSFRAWGASSAIARGTANAIKGRFLRSRRRRGLPHECACGCGQVPSQADSVFMPGHDSKVRSMGLAILQGRLKLAQIPEIAQDYLKMSGMLNQEQNIENRAGSAFGGAHEEAREAEREIEQEEEGAPEEQQQRPTSRRRGREENNEHENNAQ